MARRTGWTRSAATAVAALSLALLLAAPAQAGWLERRYDVNGLGAANTDVALIGPTSFGAERDRVLAVGFDRYGTSESASVSILRRNGERFDTHASGSPFGLGAASGATDAYVEQLWDFPQWGWGQSPPEVDRDTGQTNQPAAVHGPGPQLLLGADCVPWTQVAGPLAAPPQANNSSFYSPPGSPLSSGCVTRRAADVDANGATVTPNLVASLNFHHGTNPFLNQSDTWRRAQLTRMAGNEILIRVGTSNLEGQCSRSGLCVTTPGATESGGTYGHPQYNFNQPDFPNGMDTEWRTDDEQLSQANQRHICPDRPGGIRTGNLDGQSSVDIVHFGSVCNGSGQHLEQQGFEIWRSNHGSIHRFQREAFVVLGNGVADVAIGNLDSSPESEVVAVGPEGLKVFNRQTNRSPVWCDFCNAGAQESLSPGSAGDQVLVGDFVGGAQNDIAVVRDTDVDNTGTRTGQTAHAMTVFENVTGSWAQTPAGLGVFTLHSRLDPDHGWVPDGQRAAIAAATTTEPQGSPYSVPRWPGRKAVGGQDLNMDGRRDFLVFNGSGLSSVLQTRAPGMIPRIDGLPAANVYNVPSGTVTLRADMGGSAVDLEGLRYAWDLDGDRSTGTGGFETTTDSATIVRHLAPTSEERTIRVRATNAGGDSVERSFGLNVSEAFSGSFTSTPQDENGVAAPRPGDEVMFQATVGGGFPDNAGEYTYTWEIDAQTLNAPTTKAFVKAYEAGTHTFRLKATDTYGNVFVVPPQNNVVTACGIGCAPHMAVRWADPVTARLAVGREGDLAQPVVGERIQASGAASSGGAPPLRFGFDLHGTGTYADYGTTSVATRENAETQTGPTTVRMRVGDGVDEDTAEATVTVLEALAPGVKASEKRPRPGQSVTFDATNNTSGGERPYTYAWQVDGRSRVDDTPADGRLDVTFPDPAAEATVAVTVTDARQRTHTTPVTETVRVAQPVAHRITATPEKPDAGEQTVLSAAATTGGLGPLEYEWDLDDDGTFELDTGTDAVLPARSFAEAGDYPIAVRTTEADDETSVGRSILSVFEPLAPAQPSQSPSVARPDQEVTFGLGDYHGGLAPYTYEWTVDGDPIAGATARTLRHTFADAGRYDVSVKVTDARSRTASSTRSLKVADDLAGSFSLDNESPQVGETVTLTASPTGGLAPYRFDWDLDGDGTIDEAAGHDATATMTLTEAGEHTVTLTVRDDANAEHEVTRSFTVAQKLAATFSVNPEQPGVGQQVTFASTVSGGQPDYEYRWFVDGSETPEAQTGATLQRGFQAGEHTVELRATDAQDRTATHSKTFKVADPLVASFTRGNESPQVGETLTLTSSTQGGVEPYRFDWDLDGDGTTDEAAGHAAAATLPLTEPGEHTVKLKVTDGSHVTDDFTMSFNVARKLAASFSVNPQQPGVGQQVTFTSAVDGGTPGYSYTWFVDDSTTPEAQTGATLQRGFQAGQHTVKLRVTDAQDRTTTHQKSFKVADPLVAGFTRGNPSPQVGETLTLTSSTQGGVEPYRFDWDLDGDGTTDQGAGHDATATLPLTEPGEHTVNLTVTDGTDVRDDVTMTFTVARELAAGLTVDPAHQSVGDPITFTSSVDGGTPGYSYAWFLDDSETPEQQTTSTLQRSFGTPGRHTIKLRVTDARNRVVTTEAKSFKVADELRANFTPDNQSPQVGEAVTFASTVDGGLTPYTYDWDLDDDGTTDDDAGHGAQATRTFTEEGTHRVTLKVTDDDDVTDEVTVPIVVGGALAAHFVIVPAQPGVGKPVTFDAGSTGGGKPGYEYEWFLDGSDTPEPERTATLQRTFADPGKHTVKLRVTDSQDRVSTTDEQTFKVADPLVAGFESSNPTPQAGETVTLTSSAKGGLGPYEYDWDLDGDGTTDEGAGHGPTATLPLPAAGTRNVTLTVTDADDVEDDVTVPIVVAPALAAQFARDPQQAAVGQKVTLDGAATRGGTQPYAKYEWFVDGATTPLEETTATVQRAFDAGRHTVKLRVTDARSRTSTTEEQRFKVVDPLVAGVERDNPSPQVGETVTLTSTTLGGLAPYRYAWDLDGDGSADAAAGDDETATMTLANAGEHTVKLFVTDDDGIEDAVTMTFTVARALSAQFVRDPQLAAVGQTVTFDGTSSLGGTRPYAKYEWFVDGAATPLEATTATVQRSFAAGRHTVKLRVTDARNRTSTTEEQRFKVADPLVAGFTRSNPSPQVGETLTLTSTTVGGLAPYQYAWDVDGDGSADEAAGDEATATLRLDEPGTQDVTLTVTDDDGIDDDVTMSFVVSPALTARFVRRPEQPAVGQKVTYDAGSTVGGQSPYAKYEWFLDGSETPEPQTTATLERTFADPGRHTVRLRVTDAQNRVSSAGTQSFKVANELVADLTATPSIPDRDESTAFDAGATTGGLPPLTYRFDLDGDASTGPDGFETGPGSSAMAARSFATAGNRTIRVRVTDDDEVSDEQSLSLRVLNPLRAATTITPAAPRPGQEVVIATSGTTGGLQPFSFAWLLDDEALDGTAGELRRTFQQPGFHTAKVTVADARGRKDASEREFKVADPLASALAFTPARPQVGEEVGFTASWTGGVGPFSVSFDLDGDGVHHEPGDATSATTTYETAGERRAGVRILDTDGTETSASAPVQVVERLVAKIEARPELLPPGGETTFDASASSGGAGTRSYRWDLDGQPGFEVSTGLAPTVKRAYADKGIFAAKVQVTDMGGHVETAETAVDVGDKLRVALRASNLAPEEGTDPVVLTASASPDAPTRFRFNTDGRPGWDTEYSGSPTTQFVPPAAGQLVVGVEAIDERGQTATAQVVIEVAGKLVPDFTTKPERPEDGEETEFNAGSTRGGKLPRRYEWDFDGDGTFEVDGGTRPFALHTFGRMGNATVGLRVTDQRGAVRTTTRTLDVVDSCRRSVTVELARLSTDGCFRRGGTRAAPTFWTTDAFELNHLPIHLPSGTRLTVRMPTEQEPRARITADAGSVTLLGSKLFDAKIDWTLPSDRTGGKSALERELISVGGMVGEGEVFGLKVEGAFRVTLGREAAQPGQPPEHYVKVRLDVAIPGVRLGPYTDSPGATARVAFRHDRGGTRADALYAQLERGFLPSSGGISVSNICLSYRRAGYIVDSDKNDDGVLDDISPVDATRQEIEGCAMFDANDGEEFLKCAVDPDVDNWNGTLELDLWDYGLDAAVGIGGGQLSNMAIRAHLGDTVPVYPEVAYLRSLAGGVCLRPAPLQVKGEAVIGAIPMGDATGGLLDEDLISVAGGFHYTGTDHVKRKPWRAEIYGNGTIFDLPLARGHIGFDGDSVLDLNLEPQLKFPSGGEVVTAGGGVVGFLEGKTGRFNLDGNMYVCVFSVFCDSGTWALVSSKGVSACKTLFTINYLFGSYDFNAGFGANWGGWPSLMVESCSVDGWRVHRSPARARAAQAGFGAQTLTVGENEPALTMRVRGAAAPPKVVLRGPDGTVIASPDGAPAAREEGKWMVVEDPSANATQIQVFKPAPGTWTVETPGIDPIVGIDTADDVPPPLIDAKVKRGRGRERVLEYRYTARDDTTIEFSEEDEKGKSTKRTLGFAKPGKCAKPHPSGAETFCGRIPFRPTYGPGGTRAIKALVTRDERPVENRTVATYSAPPPLTAGRARKLEIARGKKGVSVRLAGVRGAKRVEMAVVTDMYRKLVTLKPKQRRVRLPRIPKRLGMTVQVVGYDARNMPGRRTRLRLKPRRYHAGAYNMPR